MSKINKFNEFVDQHEIIIKKLIEEAESTNKSDLYAIADREPYKKVIEMGEYAIPFLLEKVINGSALWNIGLCCITGVNYDNNVDNLNFYHINSDEVKDFWKKWASENGY
jgi:hypothetical protein